MGKSLNKIVEGLLIDFKQVTDESYLHNKRAYLIDKIIDINNSLIRESFRNGVMIDQSFYRKTDCTEVTVENKTCVINGITFTSKVDLFTATINKLLPGIGSNGLLYVGSDELDGGFAIKSLSGFIASDGNVYTGSKPLCTVLGEQLLLKNIPIGTQRLTLVGIWENVTELSNFDDDDDFPTPSGYKLQMLVKKDLSVTWGIPLDGFKSENDETVTGRPVQPNIKEDGSQ